MKFICGLVSVSFRNHSPKEILQKMKQASLKVIEWGSDVHAPYDDTEKLNQIVKLQKEYGITCCSYGTYFRLGIHDAQQLYDYIKAAKILGTNILRIWCGDKNCEEYTEQEKQHLIKEGKKAAEIAEENGVVLCLECHNNTYTNTLFGAQEILKEVNSACFQMYWQPNQFRSFEENCEYAKNIAKFTHHIHVFNWSGKNRFPLKDGVQEWIQYLSYFKGEHSLLLEFMPENTIDELIEEADALKEIVDGV